MPHQSNGTGKNGGISPRHTPKMGQRNLGYVSEAPEPNHASTHPKEEPYKIAPPNYVKTTATAAPTVTPAAPSAPPTDIIGQIIGDFGIWQLRTVLIIFLCKIPASWFMACIIFTAPELYPSSEFECDQQGLSANQTITPNQCYIEDSVEGRRECTKFLYNFDFQSLIMEFDLVCLRDIFVAWTQYWHLFGVLVGGVAGTKMMLFLSPRTVYFIGQMLQIVCGVITGYARDFSLHCAFRCLSAVCCAIMFTSGQAIFADITSGSYRLGSIILYDTFWSIGVIFLPSLSSFFNSWTHIYLGITFPTLVLTLLLQWTPESPRWLLKNGDDKAVARVADIVREGAAINDRLCKIPADLHQQLESLRVKLRSAPAPAKWLDLWKGPRATIHMLAAHLALAAFIINFMGMLLNIRSFGRDYLVPNTIAMGFSEIVGCFLALHFTLKHNKWKWQWAGAVNIIAGLIGCLGWFFSHSEMNPSVKVTLWMIIATIPKMGVSCAQSMILACMAEVMPMNKKIPYVFSVVTWARVWLLSAPFINVLKKIDVALSLSSYCALSIFGGICTCFMLTPRNQVAVTAAPLRTTKGEDNDQKATASSIRETVWPVEMDVSNTHL
ncbi:solute carrier family 22 member 13 [Stomoxys calcitrans]|uniref:solute carrier family 22 member 13 n=1 Tax=Stomoxys calcitrans TaxID=35570 RepID=UPI0027E3679D|nr:solute carrier family 22 member 13 [Stomoxys calcitrans]XP_013115032.2 solute carrier family 22 member 13 [Stomoxys calcitrans]XP_059219612.1 solute carrier family 22 member 13 [Stomoxys calcitrans]